MNNQINLFNNGYKIVYYKHYDDRDFEITYEKDEEFKWKRLEGDIKPRVIDIKMNIFMYLYYS